MPTVDTSPTEDVSAKVNPDAARPVTEEAGSDGTAVYAPITLDSRQPDAFYEYRSASALTSQLQQVIDAEGPISDAVLFRKIARSWGLERTGSRIVERLRALVPATVRRTTDESTVFYWPSAVAAENQAFFRVAGENPASRRHIDEVCIEEIAAIVLHLLHQVGSSPRTDVAKAACRLVGMSAVTGTAVARVAVVIEQLLSNGEITEISGNIRISAN